jgi:hypothetical protein
MAVMGNDNADLNNKTPARGSSQPIAQPLKAERPISVAMLQQSASGHGNQSTPQKFLQLVGSCDPQARVQFGARPGSAPVKR